MKKSIGIALLAFWALSGMKEGNSQPGDIAQKFKTLCAPCHGEKGKGDGPAAGAMTPPPRDFTKASWQKKMSDEDIFKVIKEGKGMMPAWKNALSDEEIRAMVKYIRAFGK